ncbi:MAG: SUF system NifU family Fe-S cluster assembly protein [Sandaracinaceae bacterium]|nr:SUF system NifU family Fe-S cluster assembly protein [Sandaracinaceae bacterium]
MSDLRELYQEYVLDHGRKPRNFRFPEGATHSAEGYNPLCGDKLTVKVVVDGEVIRDIGFQGAGCAISTASASTMTEAVKGKTVREARDLFGAFLGMVKGEVEPDPDVLDSLAAFAGVAEFPMRVKCATLAWHTLTAALEAKREPVTTE